jgi:O-succinylbenzoic acid--CoA ligase
MFISGGKNIHPESIERAVGMLAGVRSCCVIGVPDATWGARPVAFVDLAGESARDIRSALRDVLPPHEIPDAVYAMPADEAASAKPSRARLAARHACGERFDRLS